MKKNYTQENTATALCNTQKTKIAVLKFSIEFKLNT